MFTLIPQPVEDRARRAAGWLRDVGVRPGSRVAVVSGNAPGYVPFTLGALRSGIVPVLVNAGLPEEERDRILRDCDPALVIDGDFPDPSRARPLELAPHPLARPMHYTSGTTGASKGVWSGPLGEDDAAALVEDERQLWGAEPGDTVLVCSPLYHSAPHRIAISALLGGARVLVLDRFEAAEVVRAFAEERVTGAFLVPTHLRRLLDAGLDAPDARRVLHAGEPCPPPVKRRAIEVFGAEALLEFYGSTEGQFTVCSSEEWLERPGTVGRARPGRRLETVADVVYVSAPPFARWEYWRDPDKTAAAWRGDTFTAGDLGRLDDEGYLYLTGRREDLIITGGVNVYPAEVERILLEHAAVVEAAVYGEPDDRWGQRVCAAVVGEVDADALNAWARDRLTSAQRPKTIHVVEALPRTETGKVRRADLTRMSKA